jgi:hypothetical protein
MRKFLVRICVHGCAPFRYETKADHPIDALKAAIDTHGMWASVTVRAV